MGWLERGSQERVETRIQVFISARQSNIRYAVNSGIRCILIPRRPKLPHANQVSTQECIIQP